MGTILQAYYHPCGEAKIWPTRKPLRKPRYGPDVCCMHLATTRPNSGQLEHTSTLWTIEDCCGTGT